MNVSESNDDLTDGTVANIQETEEKLHAHSLINVNRLFDSD